MPQGTTVTPQTSLRPFWGGNGANGPFHTSVGTVDMRNWGYSYASLEYWRKNQDQLRSDATSLVNQLYGPGAVSAKRRRQADSGGSRTEYYIKLAIDVAHVPRPCSIYVYVAGKLAGVTGILGHPSTGITYAELPLDLAIDANSLRGIIQGLQLVHRLEKNLQIQFVKVSES
jgi:tyrosinase